jgi:PAS domain S-box-containing protein
LASSEERFRQVLDSADACVWEIDADGLYTYISPSVQRLLGYTPEELVGRLHNHDLFPPESREAIRGHILDSSAPKEPFQNVFSERLHKDGHRVFLESSGLPRLDAQGGFLGYRGVAKDITDRHRAQLEIQRLTDLLQESQAMAKVGGWEIDLATGCLYWTDETYRIHDTSPAKYRPTLESAVAFYAPDAVPVISAAVARSIELGCGFDHELELITAKGRKIWVRANGRPILEQAKVIKLVGAFQDITERKLAETLVERMNAELEQRVRERTAQLEASNQELEAFSYSVSHDLRGPLRGIDGFSGALLSDYRDRLDATGQHYLSRIRLGAQRMGQLIDDLLKLSRINRSELELGRVDLTALCRRVLDELARNSPERRVRVVIQPAMVLQADMRLMQVMLENLLGNAWKFTARCPDARIEVGQAADGRSWFIRDNGAGFEMAYVEKLFKAFQRLHANNDYEGTGIGLAIVQRIIHRHGGRVWAEAEPGAGATFFFSLPRHG